MSAPLLAAIQVLSSTAKANDNIERERVAIVEDR